MDYISQRRQDFEGFMTMPDGSNWSDYLESVALRLSLQRLKDETAETFSVEEAEQSVDIGGHEFRCSPDGYPLSVPGMTVTQ